MIKNNWWRDFYKSICNINRYKRLCEVSRLMEEISFTKPNRLPKNFPLNLAKEDRIYQQKRTNVLVKELVNLGKWFHKQKIYTISTSNVKFQPRP